MSLHIGNLSSNICKDDLQRTFRRFGRCNIQVKDKYGFVVYDYPASAEKALKALRGVRICGEAITLSWSKHQPRALQRLATGGKSYEPQRRNYSTKENSDRRLHLYDRQDKEMDYKKTDAEIRIGTSDLADESISNHLDNSKCFVGEISHKSLTKRHGIGGSGKNHMEDDRWDVDPSNENYLDNGMEFDRYDPYHSDGQKELEEHQGMSPLIGSPSIRKIQEITGNAYSGKSDKSCYICGDVGHKMSKCPLELKRHVPRYRGGQHPCGETVPLRYQESDWELSTSKSHQRLVGHGDSPTLQIPHRGRRKEFSDRKRNRRDYKIQHKNQWETARGPSSSSIHSDYTSSRSKSLSSSVKSLSQLPSASMAKLVPSENITLSSLPSSPSHHSRSKTLLSTSRSMSPASSLLPVEANRNVSTSPNKREKDSKGSVRNVIGIAHDMNLFVEETHVINDAGALRSENIISAIENECETKPAELEQGDLGQDLTEKDNTHYHSVSRDSHELSETHAPQSDDNDRVGGNLILETVKGMRDAPNEEHIVAPESDNSLRSNASNSLRMSSEEVCMILKHYGLQHPEENENDSPVEIYFGSARLWPWQIIYYRRLKKGPISAENYSRRRAQNKEFGIVDKYIRGSSGWGELDENNA